MDVNTLEDLKKQAQSLNDSKSELSSEELSDKAMEIYSKLNFISCDDIEAMDRFEYFDLCIDFKLSKKTTCPRVFTFKR